MISCRVCSQRVGDADFVLPSPAITSLSTRLPIPTQVWVCRSCGHPQSPDLPDIQAFYDTEYRISLQSEDHDQLYEMGPDGPIFRTAHQALLVLKHALPHNAAVLDFGAAKAATLQKIVAARPDIRPHVFDISEDYRLYWQKWLPTDAQATYRLPSHWAGTFDLITAHFVLEHVAEPVVVLKDLSRCLKPDGFLFFTVPDPIGNPGDLLVVDHLNHFVPSSIEVALHRAGLVPISITTTEFRGAYVVLARLGSATQTSSETEADRVIKLLDQWQATLSGLASELAKPDMQNTRIAVYGAGFYGALFAPTVGGRLVAFLDRNPHLQGGTVAGHPVIAPEKCPPVDAVIVALNPVKARDILTDKPKWLPEGARLIFP